MDAIVIFVKYPIPGKVKTRLGRQIGLQKAADLYSIFVSLTIKLAEFCKIDKIFITFEPAKRKKEFIKWLPAMHLFPQRGENLGERLIHAIKTVFEEGFTKTVILGSDSPTLPFNYVKEAFDLLNTHDLVIGPARDGGYYLIGLNKPQPSLFKNIHWSTSRVLHQTLEKAKQLHLKYYLLPEWYDVDTKEDLLRATRDDSSGEIKDYLQKHCPEVLQNYETGG